MFFSSLYFLKIVQKVCPGLLEVTEKKLEKRVDWQQDCVHSGP